MSDVPPGWYPDPESRPASPTVRWWDGHRWTEHVQRDVQAHGAGPVTPDGQPLAGWWWRVLGLLLDGLLLLIVTLPLTWMAQRDLQRDMARNQDELERQVEAGEPVDVSAFLDVVRDGYVDHWLTLLVLPTLLALAYHVGFLRWRGATPGKAALQMRVRPRDADGRLSWGAATTRFGVQYLLTQVLSLTGFVLGSPVLLALLVLVLVVFAFADPLWALGDRRQTLHDRAARTVVVRTR